MVTVNDCCRKCSRYFDVPLADHKPGHCPACQAASAARGRSLWNILHDAAVNTLKRPAALRWPFTGTDDELRAAVAGTAKKLGLIECETCDTARQAGIDCTLCNDTGYLRPDLVAAAVAAQMAAAAPVTAAPVPTAPAAHTINPFSPWYRNDKD